MDVTAVGGYRAIGRNMTGVTVKGDTVAIDNGIRLDTLQMYDYDISDIKRVNLDEMINLDVIPEMSRLKNVRGQVLSHGHLDHVGGLPFTKPKVPIIGTALPIAMGRREFKEGDFYALNRGEHYSITKRIKAEFIKVTHSIPDTSLVVLRTSEGNVVYACDYKFDDNSSLGKTDYESIKKLGKEGVKLLIAESTRVGYAGKTPSETVVKSKLQDVLSSIDDGLIIATTFSSHIERIQLILDEVEKTGRKPLIFGRSMFNNLELAKKLDYIELPVNARVYGTPKSIDHALREVKRNREDYFILTTGHQAEPRSGLLKMLEGKFKFRFKKRDSILFCANTIPVPLNIANRDVLERKLQAKGVRIFKDLHVSGHASKEDHRRLVNMLQPEHIIPCHGSLEQRAQWVPLAAEEGYDLNRNIHLINNGQNVTI